MNDNQEQKFLPAGIELGVGMLPDPWRDKLFKTLTRFAGRRVVPELAKQFTEEADAARGRAILNDAIAAAGAEVLSEKVRANPELAALAFSRSFDDQIDRQENLNEILRLAGSQVGDDVTADETPPDEEISDDWRRKFTGFAEDVSDEQMQSVWARILAGEFREPGTFSYRTLRLVSELSPEIASVFEEFADQVVSGDAIVTIGKEWNEGPKFMKAKALCDWGISQDAPSASRRVTPKQIGDVYLFPSNELGAFIKIPDGPDRLQISIMLLTDPGKELYKLLPRPDERRILRKILEHFVECNPKAENAKIVVIKTGQPIETVFPR